MPVPRVVTEPDRLPQTLSLAAHELRTPLAIASGYLRMVLGEHAGTLTDTQRTMLTEAFTACSRMGRLVGEMTELERLEAGEAGGPSSSFDLAALIVEVGSRITEGADRGIHLEVRATHPVMVTGDRTRLAAALGALVHAALRERSDPGVIAVECSTRQDSGRTWALVTIGDETMTRALTETAPATPLRFDEWLGGLGLALPVGRRVIEAHGGAVWSASSGTSHAGSVLRLPAEAA